MTKKQIGERLFTFAVIADTHLNQRDDECNSPFDVNKKANDRLRYVIDDLNRRELSHVIHLGDVVHPVPSMGVLYSDSSKRFHEQLKPLMHPMFIIPGNHDVGDKPIKWGPAGTVRQSFLDAWTEHFGDHYFCHEHDDAVFIGINAQVIGSGLALEKEQSDWLEEVLQQHQSRRLFLFSHYPPFLLEPDEDEHYDNIATEGRRKLLGLIEKYQVEALFAGHVHHFWYHRYGECSCYLLPSTCFTRQDYSEMFRIGPAAEHGRDDADKLGYLLVHVHKDGHLLEMVRSHGKEVAADKVTGDPTTRGLSIVNATTNRFPVMGFDLRHDWCERLQVPPSGGLEEFDRKWVRNDYGTLALWEMGVRHLRIPAADVLDPIRLSRLHDLSHLGFRFALYSFDFPADDLLSTVQQNVTLFDSWEIGFQREDVTNFDHPALRECRDAGIKLLGSPLRSKDEILSSGKKYFHVINHGLTGADSKLVNTLIGDEFKAAFDGIVIRCSLNDALSEVIALASLLQQQHELVASLHLRLTADHPGQQQNSDSEVCGRLAQAMFHSWTSGIGQFYCDSFTDNDRGYFPRAGVLDRRYNPRAGFYLVRCLHGLFDQLGEATSSHIDLMESGARILNATTTTGSVRVILNDHKQSPDDHADDVLQSHGYDTSDKIEWMTGRSIDQLTNQQSVLPEVYFRPTSL